jgi:hypothetical protein
MIQEEERPKRAKNKKVQMDVSLAVGSDRIEYVY